MILLAKVLRKNWLTPLNFILMSGGCGRELKKMSSKDVDRRLELQPARTYMVPGGPLAKDLGEVEVAVLANTTRGGPNDAGYGDKR